MIAADDLVGVPDLSLPWLTLPAPPLPLLRNSISESSSANPGPTELGLRREEEDGDCEARKKVVDALYILCSSWTSIRREPMPAIEYKHEKC